MSKLNTQRDQLISKEICGYNTKAEVSVKEAEKKRLVQVLTQNSNQRLQVYQERQNRLIKAND